MSLSGHVYLIGFMGAGKSTVAGLLAEKLGRPSADVDQRIEAGAGVPVAAIFADRGEEAFRDLEAEALATLAEEPPSVIACGGGLILRPENRAMLKSTGTVIYLAVTPGEAVARVGDCTTRPLLAGASGALAATSLLAARECLYRSAADIIIDTVGKSPSEVADTAAQALEAV